MKTNSTMFCSADIVKRAKLVMGFKRDTQLAEFLNIARPTLSNWVGRNSIDFPLLLEKLKHVDYNWLLTGKGNMLKREEDFCDEPLASGEVQMLHNSKTFEALDNRLVPLYNITVAANLRSVLEDRAQYELGKILIPNVPRCDAAISVAGDSMYPVLKSGDIVGFKLLPEVDPCMIRYGEMYVVSFNIADDEQLVVKYVNRSEREGYIKLVSYNTHHEPMDIPLSSIRTMALVKFSIRIHTMN